VKVDEQGLWDIFRWPIAIGLASAAGLLAALVGDGAWDVLSWLLLAWPVAWCVRGLKR
jgi:hypothetical protein